MQFCYSPLIPKAKEIRVIFLIADLETQGQVLLLLCRVLYHIHYCSLQAIFHVKKKKKSLISYRVYEASDNLLFWGHHSLGIVVPFGGRGSEGMRQEE